MRDTLALRKAIGEEAWRVLRAMEVVHGESRARRRAPARREAVGLIVLAALLMPASASAYPSVYVTNFGSADVSLFDAAPDGSLMIHDPGTVVSGGNPDGIAVSPDQNSFYVTDGVGTSAAVSQFDVGAGGTPVPKAVPSATAGDDPAAIAISPDGTDAYVANNVSDSVSQYDVGADGSLSPKTPATVAAGDGPFGIAVSPDGGSVYVTNGGGGISQYDVAADGTLSAKTPDSVAAGSFPAGIALTPDGNSLYSTENNSFFVRQYDVAANGTLSPKDPATVAAGTFAAAVVVSPAGDSAYVVNQQTDNVSQYDIAADGKLTAKSTATVAAGDNPFAIAIDDAGENVYVVASNDAELRTFDVAAAGGALSPTGTPLDLGGQPSEITVREDVIAPSAAIDAGPAGTVASRDASFGFSAGEPGSTFECALDGAAFAACSSPAAYSGLSDGAHSFSVRAADPWDNTGTSATRGWTIAVPAPSNEFDFGPVKRNKKKGTAVLTVNVPGPGTVELAGTAKVRASGASADDAGTATLKVHAKGKAKRKLAERGRARVRASVTFQPDGGEPNTKSTGLILKRR